MSKKEQLRKLERINLIKDSVCATCGSLMVEGKVAFCDDTRSRRTAVTNIQEESCRYHDALGRR